MKNTIQKLAQKIARTLLHIGAIKYKKDGNPYKWASGMLMRMYNDNRLLLGSYKHRWRIAMGFKNILKNQNVNIHHVLGISTAGIAPAATLAQLMGKGLLINTGEKFLLYDSNLWQKFLYDNVNKKENGLIKFREKYTIIMVYGTEIIPYGVQLANILKLPFAYIRKTPKDHGKEKQIEGVFKKEDIPLILFDGSKITEEAILEIMNPHPNLILKDIRTANLPQPKIRTKAEFSLRPKIVAVEDVISTGGSFAKEIEAVRTAGAECDLGLSIYDYGFECSKIAFKEINCKTLSILEFKDMINEAERINFFTPEVRNLMIEEALNFDERLFHLKEEESGKTAINPS